MKYCFKDDYVEHKDAVRREPILPNESNYSSPEKFNGKTTYKNEFTDKKAQPVEGNARVFLCVKPIHIFNFN